MGRYFTYDGLLEENEICNLEKERETIWKHVQNGDCIKIFGKRNYGKTSLVKNVIAKRWTKSSEDHLVLYVDFYSVTSLDNISFEMSKAFNKVFSMKRNLLEKGVDWFKYLKNIKPIYDFSTDGSSMGQLSFKSSLDKKIVDFDEVIENIGILFKKNRFKFLVVFDEFQEIAKVQQAEAKFRDALQNLPTTIPVIIMGSKFHILNEIFNKLKAPFHSWGVTVEFSEIDYQDYHEYIMERFEKVHINLSFEDSKYLQDLLSRNPEAINKFCDFIAICREGESFDKALINSSMMAYLENTSSIFSEMYASFSESEKKVLNALAIKHCEKNILGVDFIESVGGVSKTGIKKIVERLLDHSVLTRTELSGELCYSITDPLLQLFIKYFKAS